MVVSSPTPSGARSKSILSALLIFFFGISLVPYSPLGRGFLTGAIQKVSDLDPSDWRRTNPRFAEEALQNNLKLAEAVEELAAKKGCSPAQFALAWLLD